VIDIIPWMLVLVWWHPDEPGRFAIRREPHLFADEATCRLYGNEWVAGVRMYAMEYGYVKVDYACMPVPSAEEFDNLYAELEEERRWQEAPRPQEAPAAPQEPDDTPGEGQ
jgi:hypothetical protein